MSLTTLLKGGPQFPFKVLTKNKVLLFDPVIEILGNLFLDRTQK